MKVLWIIRGTEVFGEKRAIQSLMHGVAATGWEVEALSLTEGDCSASLQAMGIPLQFLHVGESPGLNLASNPLGKVWQAAKLGLRQFGLASPLLNAIRAQRPDTVHTLDKNILPVLAWTCRRLQIPCFWEMTSYLGSNYVFHFNRRLHWLLLRHTNLHPLANSLYTASTLESPACLVDTMYLGSDEKLFDPARPFTVTRASLGIDADAEIFSIIARIEPSKGQRVFCQAMIDAAPPTAHLLLVGARPDNAEVRTIQADLPPLWKNRVHFIPLTDQPEAYLALSDVVVNARIDAEPFGLSTVEGMMMGKPLLVHALGGPAETVVDGQSGWHVQEPTVTGFAGGIRRAYLDRARWKEMGDSARERAHQRYTIDVQTHRYQELVARYLHATPRPAIPH